MFNVCLFNEWMYEDLREWTDEKPNKPWSLKNSFHLFELEFAHLWDEVLRLKTWGLSISASNSKHSLITYLVLIALYMLSLNLPKSQCLESWCNLPKDTELVSSLNSGPADRSWLMVETVFQRKKSACALQGSLAVPSDFHSAVASQVLSGKGEPPQGHRH